MNPTPTRRDFLRTASVATLAAASLPSALAQTDKKVTLAFVGVAHIHTPSFMDLLMKRADVKVKCIWDHDAARVEKCAAATGFPVAKDVKEIWSDPEIAAVVICSETNRHFDLVLAGVKAGKHMFVEKPLGITAKESTEMAEAIVKAKLLFTTGYFMRTDPKHLFLKGEITKGNFGTITGVGAFGDLGTHKLDILMWLLGDVDSVTADVRSVTGRYGDCDETGEALIQFKNGVIGTLAAGWVDVDDPVQLLISGIEGHAVIVDGFLYYGSKKVPGTNSKDPYTKLPKALPVPMNQFVDAVAGAKDQPLVPPREAAARVTVMEADRKSV